MDEKLNELISLATARGSRYFKGRTTSDGLPEKISELGVFLLSKHQRLTELSGDALREELNEIQQKIDDARKTIFAAKIRRP